MLFRKSGLPLPAEAQTQMSIRATYRYESGLEKNAANYVPLTPIGFLLRSSLVYPDRLAVTYGKRRHSWREVLERCRRLAAALTARGVGRGDTVAVMAPNIPEMFEAHFGVPMAGAVLNTLNIRLDPAAIAFILQHGEAKVLLADTEFAPVIEQALDQLERKPVVIDIYDAMGPGGKLLGETDYETFVATGDPSFLEVMPEDERDAIALNYTSGTTGNPKGVVYHHRGAYLNALGNVLVWGMRHHPVYLWTLPMFHCNGWCFPWTITAMAGTHVCLRRVNAAAIYETISREDVTHLCGAPSVMNMLVDAGAGVKHAFDRQIEMMTSGAAPPAAVIEAAEGLGFHITHVDGLTECCGYVELKDRSKDIIISGGENISTIEVEDVLYRHPGVVEAAVVARPDPMWGETPCAFVTLKPEVSTTADELIAFCREHLAHFKVPRTVLVDSLPKTSTGEVQKFVLRERAKAAAKQP
jgi:fatty-acyl-CoA synthase